MACYCHPLRENRLQFHGRPLPRRHARLAQAITGPSVAFALASAPLMLMMVKDPPKSVAFNPSATIQPFDASRDGADEPPEARPSAAAYPRETPALARSVRARSRSEFQARLVSIRADQNRMAGPDEREPEIPDRAIVFRRDVTTLQL